MTNRNLNAFYSATKFSVIRGIVYAGLLIFYFIRICDQTKVREASFKNLLKRETGQGPYVQKVSAKPADAAARQAVFSMNDKKGGGVPANSR